jgi:hypothetical protein
VVGIGAHRGPGGRRRHVLDDELDDAQRVGPALLDLLDGVQHEIVEHRGAGQRQRDPGRGERPPQPSAAAVAAQVGHQGQASPRLRGDLPRQSRDDAPHQVPGAVGGGR